MSWRQRVQKASFRGVPFFVESDDFSGGRKGPVHEFPGRDVPFREDLGRKARTFSVEGHVIGEDYFNQRDALIDALEAPGPATLVHPYYGRKYVAVTDFKFRTSSSEGGVVRFSIEFAETAPKASQPTAVTDTAAAVQTTATAARSAARTEFLASYVPSALITNVASALSGATAVLSSAIAKVDMTVQALAVARHRIENLTSAAGTLLQSPGVLFDAFSEVIHSITDTAALLNIYGFNPGVRPPSTTPEREQEQANFDALHRMVQRQAVIAAAEVAPSQAYDSYNSAALTRDAITALIDELAETVVDDAYPTFMQLRADLVSAVPGPVSDLAEIVTHTPLMSLPSLVLAHQLYGNLDLEADLVARNRIQHPAFVRGGRALEVLSHD